MADFLTTEQAAQIAGCNPSTLRYAAESGKLPAVKYGKTWLIKPDDLQRWIDTPSAHKRGTKPRT